MIICDAFGQYQDKVESLLTYALLEHIELSGKKDNFLFYQIYDKPS